MLLSEWMEKSRDERRAHLDLETPCECVGYTNGRIRNELLHGLLELLGLTNDLKSRSNTGLVLHACSCDTDNGSCRNLRHLYFGTHGENCLDRPKPSRERGGKRAAELGVGAHAPGKSSLGGKKGGPAVARQKWISLLDGFISHKGGLTCHHKKLGATSVGVLRLGAREYLYLLPLSGEERLETIRRVHKQVDF